MYWPSKLRSLRTTIIWLPSGAGSVQRLTSQPLMSYLQNKALITPHNPGEEQVYGPITDRGPPTLLICFVLMRASEPTLPGIDTIVRIKHTLHNNEVLLQSMRRKRIYNALLRSGTMVLHFKSDSIWSVPSACVEFWSCEHLENTVRNVSAQMWQLWCGCGNFKGKGMCCLWGRTWFW